MRFRIRVETVFLLSPALPAAVRFAARTNRSHLALRAFARVGGTHFRPMRRPGSIDSIAMVTFASSDRRNASVAVVRTLGGLIEAERIDGAGGSPALAWFPAPDVSGLPVGGGGVPPEVSDPVSAGAGGEAVENVRSPLLADPSAFAATSR